MIWLIKKAGIYIISCNSNTNKNKTMREFITVKQQILNPLAFRIKTKQFQWELAPMWQGYQETPCVSAVESLSVVRYAKCCSQIAPVLSFISPVGLILPHWTQGSSAVAFNEAGILPLVKSLNIKCVELPHLQQRKLHPKVPPLYYYAHSVFRQCVVAASG